jgi:TonB family protein
MLAPVLAALDFLHESGFVHAGLKPSNIHAVGDNVKLSADRLVSAGESSSSWPLAAPYAAPESVLFPVSDMWSLGVSLCETLTRSLPERTSSGQFVTPDLPAPFSEIVRAALVEDATLRITLDQARSLLDPSFVPKRKAAPVPAATPAPAAVDAPSPVSVAAARPDSPEALIAVAQPARSQAAAATASAGSSQRQPLPQIDPLAVPLSPVSPNTATPPARTRIPVSSLPQVNATIAGPRRVSTPPKPSSSNSLVLVGSAAAVLLAILLVPRYFLHSTKTATPSSVAAGSASAAPENAAAAKVPTPSSAKTVAPTPSSKPAPPDKVAAPAKQLVAHDASAAAPASGSASDSRSGTRPATTPISVPASQPASSKTNPLAPTVLRKVLPVVSEKARATINGTVRVNVRVQLNPDGTVSSAELANPAGSQFFADLALKAAQQWQFGPSTSDDTAPVPSSTVIRFDFTQITTSAYLP